MNKRIKKKHFTFGLKNELYYYVKKEYDNGEIVIPVNYEMWNTGYGWLPILEKDVKYVVYLLRKDGYIVHYERNVPKTNNYFQYRYLILKWPNKFGWKIIFN